ncbi:class I SAM-dependent methyltransferase [Priestia sp. YIM B13484]|uniref:class I SAM-dependent methyltransferase n=1 Tax=Priestia sp. YIM B13484 TaxID=3366303 RepID=UPI003673003C
METDMKSYWNNRYEEGTIWGTIECPSAVLAHQCFEEQLVKNIIVPGCGYGRNSLYFAQKGFKVMGFDISNRAIHYALDQSNKFSLENLKYKVGSLFNLDFLHDKEFDGVYLSNVIHLFLKEERKQLIEIMTSLLKPGGILALSCISVYDTANYGQGEEIEPNTFMKHKNKLLHFYSEEELHDILSEDYQIIQKKLHTQTELDPSGKKETLKLWFVAAKKKIKRID